MNSITNMTKKISAAVIALLIAASATDADFPHRAVISATAEGTSSENSDTLAPGVYVAPLYKGYMHTDSYASTTNSFYGQAMLTINNDGSQKITIAVENWKFYDAFVPMIQKYNSNFTETPFNVYPEKLLKDNTELIKASEFCSSYPNLVSSEYNDWFDYGGYEVWQYHS